MTVQKGSIRLGLKKQASAGTAETAPAYTFGVESGGLSTAITQEPDDLTSGARSSSTVYRSDVNNGADFTIRANLASIGCLLYGALGAVNTTGAGPYTHVFTLANSLPIYTLFQNIVDGAGADIPTLSDAKVDELTLSWEGNGPVKVTAKMVGRILGFASSFTASVADETGLTTNFGVAGGTFKLDVDSTTPVTADLKGGTVTIKNGLTADFYSGALSAGSVSEGWHTVECAFTTVPADIDTWRTIVTGTSSGSGVAASPVYGSFEVVFKSTNAAHSLKLEAANVAFMCDLPVAEAGAGAAEVELAGNVLYSSGNSANVKATLINATATY